MSSEETLSDRISTLRSELRSYGREINGHLSCLYGDSATAVDLTANPLSAVPMLHADVLELLQDAKQLRNDKMLHELDECQRIVSALNVLREAVEAIENVSMLASTSDLITLHHAIQTMNASIPKLAKVNTEFGKSPVIGFIQKEMKLHQAQFSSRLRRLARACFHFSTGKVNVMKSLSGVVHGEDGIVENPIKLADLWRLLAETGQAQDIVNEVIREVWLHLFLPLWREKKVIPPKISNEESSSSLTFETVVKSASSPSALRIEGMGSIDVVHH